ncbi:hypothetical protein [Streptomyces sp. NPDC057580]|uniref:hypothetical protein n=1 Tax=Streptomyces sp. NPDC057580 TaxID=3346173 RepID=UPI00369AAEA4
MTFHLNLSIGARPVMDGWWPDLKIAEKKFAAWVRERGGVDGARITLTDEADGGRVLKAWPGEGS